MTKKLWMKTTKPSRISASIGSFTQAINHRRNNMSNTPETDAETMQDEWDHADTDFGPFEPSTMVSADFARKLERERDRARKLADEFHQDQTRLILERDEAREKAERYRMEANSFMLQRDEARNELLKCNEYNDELYRKLKNKII